MSAELEDAFREYTYYRWSADQANQNCLEAEQRLLKIMEQERRKNVSVSKDGFKFSRTYTRRVNTQIDEKGLRRALTARVFDKYTVRKLDRKKLEQAMDSGVVDPAVVARFVEQTPGKTFLTYRMREDQDEAEGSERRDGEGADSYFASNPDSARA